MSQREIASIPRGAEVFVDANILVYAALDRSRQCVEFIQRLSANDVFGFTTVEVLAEACHRLMLAEAVAKRIITRLNAASLVGRTAICGLSDYWLNLEHLRANGLLVLHLDEDQFIAAHSLRQRYPLMTNDSLIAAAVMHFGLDGLVSRDADFGIVSELTTYAPTDIP